MSDSLREYIYISGRKINNLSHTLPEPALRRVRELNVNLGPVGAGIGFADAATPTKHRVLVEIEKAIRESRTIKDPDASILNVGDWIGREECPLAYGNPTDIWDGGAAVFVSRIGKTDLVLCGAAEHLVDRVAPTGPVAASMSAPSQIGLLLRQAASSDDLWKGDQVMPQYAFGSLLEALTKFAPQQPAGFLARVSHVYPREDGGDRERRRVIAGTPLYVALT